MEAFMELKRYASARYPVLVTLNEDKGFRYYAGIADWPQFDAYRVNAGSADEWLFYNRWGFCRRMLWGAPLEGIGEITRTLNYMERPAPIAAWSQHAHDGWFGKHNKRKHANPTSDEVLIQVYETLANGAKGLSYFSLMSWSMLMSRNTIDLSTRIGREIRMLEELYLAGDAYWHQRIGTTRKPSLDLSAVITPEHAMLFAIDLEYKRNTKEKVFEYTAIRQVSVSFELPAYLRNPKYVFRVDADGVHDVKWKATSTGVTVDDNLNKVAVYLATSDEKCRENIIARHASLLKKEKEIGFDPGNNDNDFKKLMNDFKYNSLDEIVFPK